MTPLDVWMAAAGPRRGRPAAADVPRALPAAPARRATARLPPAYGRIDRESFEYRSDEDHLDVALDGRVPVRFPSRPLSDGVRLTLVQCEELFGRDGLYGTPGGDYPDNARRFALFAAAVTTLAARAPRTPDILHGHDWHAALLPLYARHLVPFPGRRPATVQTIHNMGYQGRFGTRDIGWLAPRGVFARRLLRGGSVTTATSTSPGVARPRRSPDGGQPALRVEITTGSGSAYMRSPAACDELRGSERLTTSAGIRPRIRAAGALRRSDAGTRQGGGTGRAARGVRSGRAADRRRRFAAGRSEGDRSPARGRASASTRRGRSGRAGRGGAADRRRSRKAARRARSGRSVHRLRRRAGAPGWRAAICCCAVAREPCGQCRCTPCATAPSIVRRTGGAAGGARRGRRPARGTASVRRGRHPGARRTPRTAP